MTNMLLTNLEYCFNCPSLSAWGSTDPQGGGGEKGCEGKEAQKGVMLLSVCVS